MVRAIDFGVTKMELKKEMVVSQKGVGQEILVVFQQNINRLLTMKNRGFLVSSYFEGLEYCIWILKWLSEMVFRLPLISCAGQLVEEEEEEQLNFDEEVQGWVEIKYDMTQDEKCISGMECQK